MNVTGMLFARILGAPLASGLATYTPPMGVAAPAIFSDRAPDAFVFAEGQGPVVVIAAPTDADPDDLYEDDRWRIVQDVRLYAYDGGSSVPLNAAAQGVRDLFHNAEADLSLDGGRVVISTVSGPVQAPTTDAAVIGRRLTLHLLIEET